MPQGKPLSRKTSRSDNHSRTPSMDRPNILQRSRSHIHDYKSGVRDLFKASEKAGQGPLLSSANPIEEETQPKYNPDFWYPAKIYDILNERYKIVAKLGYGMTASVWLAKDLKAAPDSARKFVTIKINLNNITNEFFQGRRKIAERIASADPDHPGYQHVRFMIETFRVKARGKEHLCIVYDVLREPIDSCMRKWPEGRFNRPRLQLLLKSILEGLDYLHSTCRVVHTDLKPDNIMMGLGTPTILEKFAQYEYEHPSPRKSPDGHGRVVYASRGDFGAAPSDEIITSAKIIDLGLAEWGDEKNNKSIQSNAFTAPEVLLAAGWSYPADIWNLGVMLWDITESMGLFDCIETTPGRYSPAQHLGVMIALMGPPPEELVERGSTSSTYFDENGEFRKPQYILKDQSFKNSVSRFKGEEKELFIDFARKMVTWLPEDRWTAKQLLDHPFMTRKEFDCRQSEADIRESMSLVDSFAVSKPKSRAGTPLPPGTPTMTPLAVTPARTPRSSPEPSIKAFNPSNRAHTIAHTPIEAPTSAPADFLMPGTLGASLPDRPRHSSSSNQKTQDLIDSILKKQPRRSQGSNPDSIPE